MNSLPLWIVLSPLIGSILLSLLSHTPARRWTGYLSLLGVAPSVLFVALLIPRVLRGGPVVYIPGGWSALKGIPLIADGLSMTMAGLGSILGLLVLLYAIGERAYESRYYVLVLLLIAGMLAVFLSGDLFNIYVGMEILSIASYILIAYHGRPRALLASITYLIISSVGLGLFLIGVAILYRMTGTLNLQRIAADLPKYAVLHPGPLAVSAALLLVNACVKAAVVPVHTWLGNAHSEAPSPVSALLSGVMIKVGIYLILRTAGLFSMPSLYLLLVWSGALSALFGAFVALCQDDIKRILAYSSISQIGFIVAACGTGTSLGTVGALYHLLNHAGLKSLLFLCAGIIAHQVGTRNADRLSGLGRSMPLIASACTLSALSISGIPPMGGYASKTLIAHALGHHPIPAFLLNLAGIGTIATFIKLTRIFYGPGYGPVHPISSIWTQVPIAVLTICCLALGLAPNTVVHSLVRLMNLAPIQPIPLWSLRKLIRIIPSAASGILFYYIIVHKLPRWPQRIRDIRISLNLKLILLIAYITLIALLFRVSS